MEYDTLRRPGSNGLRDAHARLDSAVKDAYGFEADDDPLAQLLALNQDIVADSAHARSPGASGLDGTRVTHYKLSL